MADKATPGRPDQNETTDPKAPKPEKDDQRLRDTSRPAHPRERAPEKSR
jgi:hypothetical protein